MDETLYQEIDEKEEDEMPIIWQSSDYYVEDKLIYQYNNTSGLLKLVINPVMNVCGILSREAPLDAVVSMMEMKGWRMATSPLPPSIRLVIMPHITEGTLNAFFNDLDEAASIIPVA